MITYKNPDQRCPLVRLEDYYQQWQRDSKKQAKHVRRFHPEGGEHVRLADKEVEILKDVMEQLRAVRTGRA
jgi:hypothetical protein